MKRITLQPPTRTLWDRITFHRIVAPRPYHVTRAEIEGNPAAQARLRSDALRRLKTVGLVLVQAVLCLGLAYVVVRQLAAAGVLS